jgi:phosphoheptose isomerase
MKAYCLNDNMPFITSVAGDKDFGLVFQDFVIAEDMGRKDVLVGISASGNSDNVIQAFMEAVRQETAIVAFVGQKECQIMEQFMRYDRMVTFMGLHPDRRGQEDLIGIATNMVVGEMM